MKMQRIKDCSGWIITLIFVLYLQCVYGQTKHYRVAALFEPENESMRLAFQNAVTNVNIQEKIGQGRNIIFDMKSIKAQDSFEANKEVCREMRSRDGIAAVFGPISSMSRAHVQSLCNAFEIPHIQSIWDPREPREYFSVSVYPDHEELSKAYADLLTYWGWKEFTVIYQDGESLIRLQKILETARGTDYTMTIRQLEKYQNTYTSMLKEIKEKHEYKIVIDCHTSEIKQILKEAESVNMLSEYYHYHFTTLDLSQLDLDQFMSKGANITSMRLIDPNNKDVRNMMVDWRIRQSYLESPLQGMRAIATETALMYDAVYMYARALRGLTTAQNVSTESLNCNKQGTWKKGLSLLNYMKAIEYDGLSGKIKFQDGKRKDFRLGIISLTPKGLIEIGHWTNRTNVNITFAYAEKVHDDLEKLKNMTLRVVTIYDPPYVINLTEPNENGQMHEGFIIDLLDELSSRLGFKYVIYEQAKRNYGSADASGRWGGMIGDLIERDSVNKADLAAAGLTITYDRAKVVDFTMPFLNLGITIIYKKPSMTPPNLFSFLSPLSPDVWIYMIAAYLCVSFMLFVIARFTPYEWENPHPCNEESEEVENQFTILNSLWFTIGSLMQQGSDIAPKASSTRFVASVWYLFTLIIVSSYTANLAAFLTRSRMDAPIKNAVDLSLQNKIKYGTLALGSSRDFFKNSNMSVYKRMNSYMTANAASVLVKDNSAGFEKVKNENYAFLAESTTIDYQVQRNCDLMQIGDILDSKGYGLASPKDSPWIDYLSKEIVLLKQQQIIPKFYKKWWVDKSPAVCAKEEEDKSAATSSALGIANVGGVFVVLAGGSTFGLLVSILEFLWKVGRNARADKQTFWSEMTEELRFIFVKCKSTRNTGKPVDKTVDNNGVTFNAVPTVPNKEAFD